LQLKVNEHPLFKSNELNKSENTIVESNTKIPNISQEARVLLKEASQDSNGMILSARYLGGIFIQTNGKNLIPSNDPREVAKWEDAIEDLKYHNLISGVGNKGEAFKITSVGYKIADMIIL
jgi:hypothetical protein